MILASGNKRIKNRNNCFAKLKNKPIIQHSLDALYENGIFNIAIACNPEDIEESKRELDLEGKIHFLGGRETFSENLELAKFLVKQKEEPALVLFGDHPFIRGYSLRYFLERCDINSYDVFHGAPTKEAIDLFKESYSAGYLHPKEFVFRAGSMFLIKPQKMDYAFLNPVYKIRVQEKIINNARLLKLALTEARKKLGWDALGAIALFFRHFGIRFLYNHKSDLYYNKLKNSEKSSIKHLEDYAAKILSPKGEKIKTKTVAMPFGELAFDIDELNDFKNYENNYYKILEIMEKEVAMMNVIDLNAYRIARASSI